MTPLTPTICALDGLDNFRLQFPVKDRKAVEVIGLSDDGRLDASPRTK
jgi:hypothetical protein